MKRIILDYFDRTHHGAYLGKWTSRLFMTFFLIFLFLWGISKRRPRKRRLRLRLGLKRTRCLAGPGGGGGGKFRSFVTFLSVFGLCLFWVRKGI